MTRLYHPALSTHGEEQYLDMLRELLAKKQTRETRNDAATRSLFGRQIRFDLANGFPLLTTKKTHWRSILVELLWFLRGDTNVAYLHEHGVTIWDEWKDENGDLGPVYGEQWRAWPTPTGEAIDQIANVINDLRTNPYSRRHLVVSWNVSELSRMALPPCHCLFQFYVGDDERLHLQLYQRSADTFLGVPFNIASYAALLMIVAAMIGREPGEFIHTFGDFHLYEAHTEQASIQVKRQPLPFPSLVLEGIDSSLSVEGLRELDPSQFTLKDYNSHSTLKAPVAR